MIGAKRAPVNAEPGGAPQDAWVKIAKYSAESAIHLHHEWVVD